MSFGAVGPLAGRPFYALAFAGAFVAALVAGLRPAWRSLLIGLAIPCAPRFIALAGKVESHHVLFPLFWGMAAGLMLRKTVFAFGKARLPSVDAKAATSVGLRLFLLFLALALVRAYLAYYSPFVLMGYPRVDREVAPGVSANHAFYLSSLLLLHLAGPAIYLLCDRNFRASRPDENETSIALDLLRGLVLGAAANLLVILLQLAGVDRLWIATARSREAGRLPGLFTDSGAATVLWPVLLAAIYVYWSKRFAQHPGARRRRMLLLALLFVVALGLGQVLGRGFYVALTGLSVLPLLLRGRSAPAAEDDVAAASGRSYRMITAGAILCAGLVFAASFWRSGSASVPHSRPGERIPAALAALEGGEVFAAYEALNLPRARQAQAGVRIFREAPAAGAGANSFMVEARRFASDLPGLEIDNPANLASGLLSDLGLTGLAYLALVAGLYALDLRRRRHGGATAAEVFLAAVPLVLAPGFLFGYHIVFAEYSAILLLPLALSPAPQPAGIAWRGWVAAGVILAHTACWGSELALATRTFPPAYWRADHGARPAPGPERTAVRNGSTLFYYKDRRNFALAAGSARADFRLLLPAANAAAFYCYGAGERLALANSVSTGPSTANEPGTTAEPGFGSDDDSQKLLAQRVRLELPAACRVYPNLEVQLETTGRFALPAGAFAEGRLQGSRDRPSPATAAEL